MTNEELIQRHPRVWHMAADGSWEGIKKHGLLSVTRLLDLYGITGDDRLAIESARRPQSVVLSKDGMPGAIVRDNKPMYESVLTRNLQDGLVPRDWYEILNRKSFFWVDRDRLERLLNARAYAGKPQIILEIETEALLAAHERDIYLSAINSGQTLYGGAPRGLSTFKSIKDFPVRSGKGGAKQNPRIVELVVDVGVPDIASMVLKVERVHNGKTEVLFP